MKKIRFVILAAIVYALIAMIFMGPAITRISEVIYGPVSGTDYRGTIRHCWWVKYAFEHGVDWRNDYMLNYPFGDTYDWSIMSPLWQLYGYPLAIIWNESVAFNMMFLLSFIFSGLTMFLLAFYVTRDRRASFIAGLLYAFCPYHFNKIWEHLGLALIEWLPLYVLCLLRLRKHTRFKDVVACGVAMMLVVITDFYYAYFMLLFTVSFIAFVFLYQWRIKVKALFKRSLLGVKQFIVTDLLIALRAVRALFVAFILSLPATWPFLKKMLFPQASSRAAAEGFVRSFHYLFTQSARPLNYLFPSPAHPVLGQFTKNMFGSIFYGRGSIEQTLSLGFVSLFLAYLALRAWKAFRLASETSCEGKRYDFLVGFFLFSAIASFILSMPPYFNLAVCKIYFPSYFLYQFFPMFRAYARFGIFVMLCISVLAGIGFSLFLRNASRFKKNIAFCFVCGLILFEFSTLPPYRYIESRKAPEAYAWLAEQEDDCVIAEYPMGQTASGGETYMELDYPYYQRIHKKKLLNGAPPETFSYKIKDLLKIVEDADTPSYLRWLGVDYVFLHLDEYAAGTNDEAIDVLGEVPQLESHPGYAFIEQFGDIQIYKVVAQKKCPIVTE